jgi:hypothetical protein
MPGQTKNAAGTLPGGVLHFEQIPCALILTKERQGFPFLNYLAFCVHQAKSANRV